MSSSPLQALAQALKQRRLAADPSVLLESTYDPLTAWILKRGTSSQHPMLLGIGGAQGSGKTTLTILLAATLEARGQRVARFSIDDLYLTRLERQRLAEMIHPLLITRGVPGTHDLILGNEVLNSLMGASPTTRTAIPSFDKATDDRRPRSDWPIFIGRPDVILLEGWCVGARAQAPAKLRRPINRLERDEDSTGEWRRWVNQRLGTDYADLYRLLDSRIFLEVPSWDHVLAWRKQQEDDLLLERGTGMTGDQLRRFIQHYERITQWMLQDCPKHSEVHIELGDHHEVERLRFLRSAPPEMC